MFPIRMSIEKCMVAFMEHHTIDYEGSQMLSIQKCSRTIAPKYNRPSQKGNIVLYIQRANRI
jgi:hypothetical protein